jgi:hypothetical protein
MNADKTIAPTESGACDIGYNFLRIDHCIHWFETFSCLKLIYGPQQHGLMFGSSYLNHLDMSS